MRFLVRVFMKGCVKDFHFNTHKAAEGFCVDIWNSRQELTMTSWVELRDNQSGEIWQTWNLEASRKSLDTESKTC